ncbi:hypothetical protein N9937_00905 [bacterium]|nr:hypothetical protein [bacterium]
MKKVLVAVAISMALIVPQVAQAGDTMFGSLGDIAMKARNAMRDAVPTEAVAIEADGGNFRGYLFDAPFNPAYVCLFSAGTQKGGMSCYPKANPAQLVTPK